MFESKKLVTLNGTYCAENLGSIYLYTGAINIKYYKMLFGGAVRMVRSITRLFINVVQAAVLLCIFAFPACAEPIYSGNGNKFMQEFQQDYADICHRSISKPDVSLSEDGGSVYSFNFNATKEKNQMDVAFDADKHISNIGWAYIKDDEVAQQEVLEALDIVCDLLGMTMAEKASLMDGKVTYCEKLNVYLVLDANDYKAPSSGREYTVLTLMNNRR